MSNINKGKGGFMKKRPIKTTYNIGDDDNGMDSGDDRDKGKSGGGGPSKTKPKTRKKRGPASEDDSDAQAGDSKDEADSGQDNSGDDSEIGAAGDINDDVDQQGNKPKTGGAKKPKGIGKGEGSDNEDGADNEDEGAKEELNETQQTALDIAEIYKLAGSRPPTKLRRTKPLAGDNDGPELGEGQDDGEPDEGFINEVKAAMDQIDEDLEKQISQVKADPSLRGGISITDLKNRVTKLKADPKRRGGILIADEAVIDQLGKASKIIQEDGQVKKILPKISMQVGGVAVRVISVIGGVALFGVGTFLTVATCGADEGAGVKAGAAIAKQIIKAGEKLSDMIDKKLEKGKLETAEAKQLMGLLGTNMEAVMEDGSINEGTLATFSKFKLMAAAEKASKAEQNP